MTLSRCSIFLSGTIRNARKGFKNLVFQSFQIFAVITFLLANRGEVSQGGPY